ncbi:uncharacterized protein AMSG_09643 [Thecamonas trahens ATCC 50062]|uniref:Uncharacterized protein n=1 Tax=Thecamonas trahens ATCC 50062 TaxID=461836 RepID=A0A0L0DNV4_THETB|nr:hypothetical protein AMSG_09643 [Thecamonas trahens ATCC 50062]KNC53994.1 hypothetical protein AMSG_09643 [Thecamonas trahens ATCC 50062]|eukprot:XP_013754196.1 hypothetical protein AMSG_09643 [Thecamonas trahens ATCC 50062]
MDLDGEVMDSAVVVVDSAVVVVDSAAVPSLEKEYIYNLQQQVYFMEMELKLLRESGAVPGSGGGGGGGGGGRSMLPPDIEAASRPLDDTINSLKVKYKALQDEHKEEMAVAKETQEELEAAATKQHFNILHLRAEIAGRDAEILTAKEKSTAALSEATQRHMDDVKTIEGLGREIEVLEGKLASKAEEAAERTSEASAAKLAEAQALARAEETAKRAEKAERRYNDLLVTTESIRARVVELEEERGTFEERIEAEHAANKVVSDAKWEVELELKKVNIALDQAQRAKEKVDADLATAVEETIAAQSVISDLRRDKAALELVVQQERATRDENKIKRIEFQNEAQELRQRMADVKAVLEGKDEAISGLEKQLERSQLAHAEALAAIEELQADLSRAHSHSAELADRNAVLKHDKAMLQNELAETEATLAGASSDLADTKTSNIELLAEIERLKSVVAVSEDIQNLKIEEFQNMLTSNSRVADGLRDLIGDLQMMKDLGSQLEAARATATSLSSASPSRPASSLSQRSDG